MVAWFVGEAEITHFYPPSLKIEYLDIAIKSNMPVHIAQPATVQDWQVPLGRRFRALKLWFVMRTYGGEGLRGYLRHHISLASNFAKRIERDPRFKLAAIPRFSLVCFTLTVRAFSYSPTCTSEKDLCVPATRSACPSKVAEENLILQLFAKEQNHVRIVTFVRLYNLNEQVRLTGDTGVLLTYRGVLS
jgi:glutamate/tyrosine decarboxylase-like PLP-dependent enzyme